MRRFLSTARATMEVARQLAGMMGYSSETWGGLTSCGTLANFEALWVARTLKYFLIAARESEFWRGTGAGKENVVRSRAL